MNLIIYTCRLYKKNIKLILWAVMFDSCCKFFLKKNQILLNGIFIIIRLRD